MVVAKRWHVVPAGSKVDEVGVVEHGVGVAECKVGVAECEGVGLEVEEAAWHCVEGGRMEDQSNFLPGRDSRQQQQQQQQNIMSKRKGRKEK